MLWPCRGWEGRRLTAPFALQPGGQRRGLGTALHTELGQQVGDVVLDGLLRQVQPLADLPVGQPLADQLQDVPFLVGQAGQRVLAAGLLAQPGQHGGGGLRIQQGLAGGDGAHRADQVGAVDLLEHITGGAGHDGGEQGVVVGEGGQHQAGHGRQAGADLPADVHAAAVGQAHVQHGDVGLECQDAGDGRLGGPGLADDLDVVFGVEQCRHAAPYHLVVVHEEHANHGLDANPHVPG
nr:hypothetical protein GCM10020093_019940 [Planobispora longispora]